MLLTQSDSTPITLAEIVLPSDAPQEDLGFYTDILGLKLEEISPADDPNLAVLSGHGLRLRLVRGAHLAPGCIRILTDDPDGFAGGKRVLTAPNGTRIEIFERQPAMITPKTEHAFVVRRLTDEAPWVIGRAGMNYRDLIPTRLGGSIIASHIRIPGGGEIPDMVHFHKVGFQLIFCYKGWVDVLYEDQGGMIRLHAGDCVTQPPEIRHRVMFASPDIEVIEIGVPAEHVTSIDHAMELPNGKGDPDRLWQGQRFVHHIKGKATWQPFRIPGFRSRDTGIAAGTNSIAGVQVVRFDGGTPNASYHNADIHFTFVMEGNMRLESDSQPPRDLGPGDAFVLPPNMVSHYTACSENLELLEVSLPGVFQTTA